MLWTNDNLRDVGAMMLMQYCSSDLLSCPRHEINFFSTGQTFQVDLQRLQAGNLAS